MAILFLGDLYYDYDYITQDILEISDYIKKNNYSVILNLEGSITNSSNQKIKKRGEHLCQSNKVIEVLKLLNVKGVILSNNHMFDYLEEGVKDTIEILEKNNIPYTGIVGSKEEKPSSIFIQDGNQKYEIFAATDPYEESYCRTDKIGCSLIKDIMDDTLVSSTETKKIAFLHTGFEYNTLPTKRTIKECRKLIDKGFECVISSHPHIVQPYEKYNNKCIFYSIGNFYFSSFKKEFHDKEIRLKPNHYCDLGYGVIIEDKNVCIIGIDYNTENLTPKLLEDYEAEEIDFSKFINYKKEYYKNRNNHNFYLTGNNIMDEGKMFLLNTLYKIYRKVKHLD